MIVIKKINLSDFQSKKSLIQSELEKNFIDIVPVEIQNNLFILPESVLNHEVFKKIFDSFKTYEIREVNENEFIKTELI